jgi:signal transduction histidine kinase/DNA-binding NarL/FixJ family response regulator
MCLRHSLGACGALILTLNSAAVAQQYSFRHYGADDGLQNLAILSLAQDGAGYIWAGSEGGLYRYDGTRFRLMAAAEGLPCTAEVHALHVAADGALWANTCAQIFRFDGQRFHPIAGLSGMLAGTQRMVNDAQGHIVVASPSGLYQVVPNGAGSFSTRPYLLEPALAGMPMRGIARNGSQLWFGCGQRLCVEEQGRVSMFGPMEGLPNDAWDAIGITPDGSVWTRSPSRLYRKAPGSARLIQEKPDIASSIFWGALTVGRDGSVMVPTDKGLAIYQGGNWRVIDERRGLRTPMTSAVLEDREGSLWIATIGGGVARWLGNGTWEAWTKTQGLPSDLIWSIRRDRKGALWVGTSLGLVRLDGQGLRTWSKKDGLGGDNVRWLGETSDGSVWAVVKPGSVARIDSVTGKIRLFGPTDGLPCETSQRGFVDHLDRLWIATTCGVFRNDRPSASDRFHRIDQPVSLEHGAWSFSEDKQGTMWITNPDGLWSLRDGRWRQYRKADGLLSDHPYITTIAWDGVLWLHHRFDAGIEKVELLGDRIVRSTPVVPADALSVEVTAFHGFDVLGRLWRGSANGVSVLAGGSWSYLSTEDGLIWNDTDGEAFWADPDGSVWIGTSGGLAHYRPPNGGWPGAMVADPVITGLEMDQKSRVLRAQFSSLSYKSEQLVHFAFRLDGEHWIDTTERVISFAGLAPGRHRLEIRSRVRAGPVSEKVAVAEFQIEPKWWETWWLRSAALLLGAAAVWGVIVWRHGLLRRRNRQLEQAVLQRTAELESERTKVLDATRAKSEFLARMSHEIRTPMNAILGMADLLWASKLNVEQRQYVGAFRSAGHNLLTLINDILDLSKIEAGRINLQSVDFNLDELVEAALDLIRVHANDKGLDIVCEISPKIHRALKGDPDRLRQVLINLLGNAVKFTEAGQVTLRIEREPVETDGLQTLRFSVSDTGSGIPLDKQSLIFETFTQADSSISRQYGGTGLGLTISRQIVERMGGRLEVSSIPGKGSTFSFSIPLEMEAKLALSTDSTGGQPSEQPVAGLRILLAEDSKDNQLLVSAYLKQTGWTLEIAADGQAAVDKFISGNFDLVLMDVQMPVMDGYAATRTIREWEARQGAGRTPILVLSAHAMGEAFEKSREAGCDAHLTKPIRKPVLLRAIAEHCKARGAICVRPSKEVEELVPQYLDMRRSDVAAMAAALRAGDYDAIRIIGHNMKGSGTAYGFDAITKIGASLEAAAKKESNGLIGTEISALGDYLDRVKVVSI